MSAPARACAAGRRIIIGLLTLVFGGLAARSGPARAEIVVDGGVVEFRGDLRPGDIPTVVRIDAHAFADVATEVPECTDADFAASRCRTQYTDSFRPISVQQALGGYSPKTAYQHKDGDLVFHFSDNELGESSFLPRNGVGADLAVFLGYTQSGFAIKVHTRDGAEYGFADVDSAPFIQIAAPPFDPLGDNWGPCLPERPLSICGTFPNFSGLLLMFQIDLDTLGVPPLAVVDEVVIRRKQSADPLGTEPFLVMVGALNTFEAAPALSDHIRNGRFGDALMHWAIVGDGSVQVTPPIATLTAPGTPVALTQAITTPNESYEILFDYRFLTESGRLVVSLDGVPLREITAPSPVTGLRRERIYVNDVSLMDLENVEFRFEVLPASDVVLEVTNIGIPKIAPATVGKELLKVHIDTDYIENPSRALVKFEADQEEIPVLPTSNVRVEVTHEELLTGEESIGAAGFAELTLLGELRFGAGGAAFDSVPLINDPSMALPNAVEIGVVNGRIEVNHPYRVQLVAGSAPPPDGIVDVDWRVGLRGELEVAQSIPCLHPVEPNPTKAEFTATASVSQRNHALQSFWAASARLLGGINFLHLTPGLENEEAEQFADNELDPANFIDFPPSQDADTARRVFLEIGTEVEDIAHAQVGEVIGITWVFKWTAQILTDAPDGDCPAGYAIVDFLDTFTGSPTSDTPGIEFVPVDPTGGGENQPPVADAGANQTLAADAVCMADVTLDGSGSSDPDDDPLTYSWTGPFGMADGVSPTVTLGLGSHDVTLTVDDGNGGMASDDVLITVEDQTPPVIETLVASPAVLWPPNHELVPIAVQVVATDNCGTPVVTLTSIVMNEGEESDTYDPEFDTVLGDGHTPDDIVVDAGGNILLRAERSGTGTGRVYTIEYTATDAAGNSTSGSTTVTVPLDLR